MKIRRLSLDQLRKLKSRTNRFLFAGTTDKDIKEQVMKDPDLVLPTEAELREFKPVKKRWRK